MSPRRFLVAFTASALVGATTVVAVTVFVNPLGVLPLSPSVPGVNVEKVMRLNNDRIHKPLDLFSVRPRTVVLGTSRILQAFDPRALSGTVYGPAYNYGLAGGDVDELEQHFEKFISRTPSVERAFVELFLPRALARSDRRPGTTPQLVAATLFSWSALYQSAETVWQNARRRMRLPATGPITLDDGRQSFVGVSTVSNFLAYPRAQLGRHRRYELPFAMDSLRRMKEVARRRGIELIFFISPMHAVQLYGLHVTGDWTVFEEWKRELAREFDVLDFSRYTAITEEPVSSHMRYWLDPHHFSPLTGQLVIERLLTWKTGSPTRFGVPLASGRLEQELRASRAARDAWIARNRAWVELFRVARGEASVTPPMVDGMPGMEMCPADVSTTLLSRLTPARPSAAWMIVSYRTTLDPPIAVHVRTTGLPGEAGSKACELTIVSGPEVPSAQSADWRIGHRVGDAAPLRGRTIRYTVRARASAPLALNTGTIYVNDGVSTSAVPLTALTPAWRSVTVEHRVSPVASTLEVWVQLVAGQGTIRPVGATIYFRAAIDLVEPSPGSARVRVWPTGDPAARRPVSSGRKRL